MFFYSELIESIIKNWYQKQILSGSLATSAYDVFGWSVAMNSAGDRIIVGAYQDEVIGAGSNSGLAYMFVSGTSGWTQQHILSGTLATDADDYFGYSVSINSTGDRVVIGAPSDERNGGSAGEGLAYIFVSGTSGWTQQYILSGTLAVDSYDNFGISVAINAAGDRIVVGASRDETLGGSSNYGLAYVFVSGADGWSQEHIMSGSLAIDSFDQFGRSVAINSLGDRVVIGASNDERIGGSAGSGLAYIFVSGTSGWTQQYILSGTLATESNDNFGVSVSINSTGDRVVVGASPDERISGSAGEGLAYVFVSGADGWSQEHIMSGSLAIDSSDSFGISVAINAAGDRIVVGAASDERISGSAGEGLAYMFVSGASGWTQQHILSGTLATDFPDYFGYSVAMNSTGDRVIVGAYQDERISGSAGEGLAYVFNEE